MSSFRKLKMDFIEFSASVSLLPLGDVLWLFIWRKNDYTAIILRLLVLGYNQVFDQSEQGNEFGTSRKILILSLLCANTEVDQYRILMLHSMCYWICIHVDFSFFSFTWGHREPSVNWSFNVYKI